MLLSGADLDLPEGFAKASMDFMAASISAIALSGVVSDINVRGARFWDCLGEAAGWSRVRGAVGSIRVSIL